MSRTKSSTCTAEQIRANAHRLWFLHARVSETVKLRSTSPAEWEAASADFHSQFGDLFFPNGEAGWSDFMSTEGHGVYLALLFLEVDQYTFRSGYLKEFVWKRLKKLPIPSDAQDRLEKVGLMYLQKRVHREFWPMANFMRLRGSPRFWQDVEILAKTGAEGVGVKARWMLLARDNAPVRRWISSELSRARYEPGYVPRLNFLFD
jgi:hypothetical protein